MVKNRDLQTAGSTTAQPTTILKVIVGSHAHGLAHERSDVDYRGVFVHPTSDFLKLGENRQVRSWSEKTDDDTSWEVGHYLFLSIKSNPTVLETYLAPRVNELLLAIRKEFWE